MDDKDILLINFQKAIDKIILPKYDWIRLIIVSPWHKKSEHLNETFVKVFVPHDGWTQNEFENFKKDLDLIWKLVGATNRDRIKISARYFKGENTYEL